MRTCGGYGFTKANGNVWFTVKCKLVNIFNIHSNFKEFKTFPMY